ncbi:MAG: cell division protein ZapE [Pseudomonadota bacterium]
MTPKQHYQTIVREKNYHIDSVQLIALEKLEHLYQQLQTTRWQTFNPLRKWFKKPLQGLYLWGSVGIGKTFLMDIFHACLPKQKALRIHFHPFMRFIHGKLEFYQGKKNPLTLIAKELARQYDVLCFDEFFVNDIGNAMILKNVLMALFDAGLVVVTTSNLAPDELYKKGLHRARFLPAIEVIKQHVDVMHLPTQQDYRVFDLKNQRRYVSPHNQANQQQMHEIFKQLSEHVIENTSIVINEREIKVFALGHHAIWFEFQMLCSIPRSQNDYIEIARYYPIVFISDVPQLEKANVEASRYFIDVIDVFYDQKIKLFICAEVDIDGLKSHPQLQFDFTRTRSRLHEMMQG